MAVRQDNMYVWMHARIYACVYAHTHKSKSKRKRKRKRKNTTTTKKHTHTHTLTNIYIYACVCRENTCHVVWSKVFTLYNPSNCWRQNAIIKRVSKLCCYETSRKFLFEQEQHNQKTTIIFPLINSKFWLSALNAHIVLYCIALKTIFIFEIICWFFASTLS